MHTYEDVGEEKAKNTSCVLSTCFLTYEVVFKLKKKLFICGSSYELKGIMSTVLWYDDTINI